MHQFVPAPGRRGRPAQTGGGIEDLYRSELRPMLRVATLMLGSAFDAEDVVHDAFTKVERRLDELERPGAYLRTCVVNGCRSLMRHQKVADRYRLAGRAEAEVTHQLPTHLVELKDALDVLGERQRTVIILRYFVDLPDAEISEIMGVSPITIRTITHRALKILRAELAPSPPNDDQVRSRDAGFDRWPNAGDRS